MSKRGNRIAERQKQCTGCQFLTSIKVRERGYGFCRHRVNGFVIWISGKTMVDHINLIGKFEINFNRNVPFKFATREVEKLQH